MTVDKCSSNGKFVPAGQTTSDAFQAAKDSVRKVIGQAPARAFSDLSSHLLFKEYREEFVLG